MKDTINQKEFQLFIIMILLACSFFSPLITLTLVLIILVLFSKVLLDFTRQLLSVIFIYSGSIIISSRKTFATVSDDFSTYYSIYNSIYKNGFENLSDYLSSGLEIGLPIIFWIYGKIFPFFSPSNLIFVNSLVIGLLFIYLIEKRIFVELRINDKALLLASVLLFFSFPQTSQLVRQMFSSVFILYAVFSNNKYKTILWFLVASLIHLSAIPIYIMIKFIFKWPKIATSIVCIILGLYSTLIVFLGNSGIEYFSRLNYYLKIDESGKSLLIPLLTIIILIIFLINNYLWKDENINKFKYLFFVFAAITLFLMNYTLISLRVGLLYQGFLIGFFLYLGYQRFNYLYKLLLLLLIIFQFKVLINSSGPMGNWYKFDWISIIPGYFFIN